MLSRKYIWLGILLTMIMVIGLIPAGFAQTPDEFAYVPNAFEASVSKVNLSLPVPAEIARYSTIPFSIRSTTDPEDQRTSRLAVDSMGNAWAVNTTTGQSSPIQQGTIARISSTPVTSPETTSIMGGLAGMVFPDDRVSFFNIGLPGDDPRTINIVESEGELYIWIGFYEGSYFQKYHYNTSNSPATLEPVSDGRIDVGVYSPYSTAIDSNGIMWVSSRNAGTTYGAAGTPAIFSFDTNALSSGIIVGNKGTIDNPYHIMLDSKGMVWLSGAWPAEQGFAVYDSNEVPRDITPTFVNVANGISIVTGVRAMLEFEDDIWFATVGGQIIVLRSTLDTATYPDGFEDGELIFSGLAENAGLSMDNQGFMWSILHGSDKMFRFDPKNPSDTSKQIEVNVGNGPYAYGGFVVPPETYGFCGYKFFNDTEVGLQGWTIELRDQAGGLIATTTTDEDGKYCFSDLPAGTYTVLELQKTAWLQVFPGGDGKHTITLPGDLENLVVNGDFELGNNGFTNGYNFVDPATDKAVSPYTMGMGNEKTYTIGVDPFNYHDLWASFADHTEDDVNNLMMIVNGSDDLSSPAIWTQTVPVTVNSEYTFSFWGATSYPAAFALIDVYINDVLIDTFDAPETVGTWTEFSTLWNSGIATSAEIKLVCTTEVHTGNDFALDDFSMVNNFNFRNRERAKECFSETAWAYGGDGTATANNTVNLNNSEAWGWTNDYNGVTQTYELWAAAGQNILANGVQVGTVTVAPAGDGCVTVTYQVYEEFTLAETHLWVGETQLPLFLSGGKVKEWVPTSAPGLFDKAEIDISGSIAADGKSAEFTVCGLGADIWVAAHAVVDWCEYIE